MNATVPCKHPVHCGPAVTMTKILRLAFKTIYGTDNNDNKLRAT